MSTQNISQVTFNRVQNNLDKVLSCIADKMVLESKLAFKSNINSIDIFKLNYLTNLITNERNYCINFEDDCSLEKVSRYINKFK